MLLRPDPTSVLLISWWDELEDGEIRIGHPLGRAAKGRCSFALFPVRHSSPALFDKIKITPELLYKTIKIRLNRFSPFVLFEISNHQFDLPVFPSPIADDFAWNDSSAHYAALHYTQFYSISTVMPTVHTHPSRKRPELFDNAHQTGTEFENAGFSFSCGQKTFWKRGFSRKMTSR